MIRQLKCDKNMSLVEAWKLINANAKGIIFVIEDEDRLCGILTDGDIRRFLISGGRLETPLTQIMNKNFVSASVNSSHLDLMNRITDSVKIIPLTDEDNKLVDYFEYRTDIHVPVAIPDLKGNEFNYLVEAFLSTWISSSGDYIEKFEGNFSKFCNCQYGVAVSNGTVALHLALVALGIGPGDEVIVPDLTFAATVNSVLHANATPVIVDIEEDSWCIDPDEIEKAITSRTKAIIPVHLYGQPCNMHEILRIAKKYKLFIIEDCAEAHGAEYGGKKVGSFGDISCFSFYGNKIITTGEGGMCLTNNTELNARMRVLRDHGMSKSRRYWHDVIGYNYRMTNLQAAIGLAQLERILDILKNRELIENKYKSLLGTFDIIEFQNDNLSQRKKITWLVSVLISDIKRDLLIERLRANCIDVRPFFYPLSQMDLYKKYVFSSKVSNEISCKGINFPTNNNVNQEILYKIKQIISNIKN